MRVADLAQRLAQALELDLDTAFQMARRIQPVLLVEDVGDPWTNDAHQIRPATGFEFAIAGGAGKYSVVQLSNGYNVGSFSDTGVLVVLTKAWLMANSATDIGLALALNVNMAGTISAELFFSDSRLWTRAPAASVRGGNTMAALETNRWAVRVPANYVPVEVKFSVPMILASGHGFLFQNQTANDSLQVALEWFEVDAPLLAK